jgi:molybdopterin/thiamine biosynthesis adenylyltransferase
MQTKTGSHSTLYKLINNTLVLQSTYKPIFYRLQNIQEKNAFEELIRTQQNLQVYDYIVSQVEELIKCVTPTIGFLPATEIAKIVESKFGEQSTEEYGVWVYYPWAQKLVHILDEEEFAIVRTNRNKYKITEQEQQTLATKKIGVMGLSVGQSVSLALAMERSFGELRIADFDELDLSNINRIRTGVYNLKIKKTVIVAREIAEIDPFLNVVCFEDGITEENLELFLTENGKLDLLIDECDSFDIKINSRTKAKSLGIPVLMEGSDRGTIDIERFDLEPERPVLHGMVEHLDMSKYKSFTTMDEKIPYIAAVTGIETLSTRMKASAIELMSTISTWPQLASAVIFGGGITADLSRKILLGNLSVSGRFFIDMDELICNPVKTDDKIYNLPDENALSTQEIEDFIKKNQGAFEKTSSNLDKTTLNEIIGAALKAPSGGNSQPWRWHYQNGLIHLFLEPNASKAYLDPQQISSYVSLGTAIENLSLAAATFGFKATHQLTPQLAPLHIAYINFEPNYQISELENKLFKQIEHRHTNRKITPKQEIDNFAIEALNNQVKSVDGAQIKWISDPKSLKEIGEIASKTDLLRMFIAEAHEDFIIREMRWNLDEVNHTEDGIGIHTLDLSNNDEIGIRLLKDKNMIKFLQQINGGSAFKRLTMTQFMSSSAIGLITMPSENVEAFINTGIAAERLWLAASDLNLQIHPVNVPLIFFYKNRVENSLSITTETKHQLLEAENKFRQIFEIKEDEQAIFMFRIFKASPSPKRTIRKHISKTFSIGRV